MPPDSRIPGFYKLSLAERHEQIAVRAGITAERIQETLENGGLSVETADKIVENVLGTYSLPFGIALNVRVNGQDRLVPMVVEEPSVIAAASNAAKMVRQSGGFTAEMLDSWMIAQIELRAVPNPSEAVARLEAARERLLGLAAHVVPGLLSRGGGPRGVEVRDLGQGMIVLHVLVDCCDAMGANLVNSIAEALGPVAAEIAHATLGLRILSNLCDRRRVRVSCRVHPAALLPTRNAGERVSGYPAPVSTSDLPPRPAFNSVTGEEIVDAIVAASRFAEVDPYRAATHNKGIMNGVDAVVLATGNDFRAVEAGAHAYAAHKGRYAPLSIWRKDGQDLVGELEMPLALGTVGGTLRVHAAARLALEILGISSADELALITASVGLASNLAALRALATEGIQRGHMSLHARSVAIAAGAVGDEVELVASHIALRGQITREAAQRALVELSLR